MRIVASIRVIACLSLLFLSLSSLSAQESETWHTNRTDYSKLFVAIRSKQNTRIMHIGDSHINGDYTTSPIREALGVKYGNGVSIVSRGINGATFTTWLQDSNVESIKSVSPDLLIISLGTNDSYTRRFSGETLRASVQALVQKVREVLPDTQIILTTPPANYLKDSRSVVVGYAKATRRKAKRPIYRTTTSYSFNPNTRVATNTLKYCGKALQVGVIDLNASIGTKAQAEQWLRQGWMATDRVHFTEAGYAKQGQVIAEALIGAIDGKSK